MCFQPYQRLCHDLNIITALLFNNAENTAADIRFEAVIGIAGSHPQEGAAFYRQPIKRFYAVNFITIQR
ncbi:hypothetical protein RF55_24087 [Lasius niger]|uniref:Uncharacterized protein n=1 Tax=Lasius niger TaxID=67767 RepID=A0A0J7JV74_LASNI|nr:hypothetical protein RF55_24087 [Lasius niger]